MKKTVKKVLLTTFATVLACSATGLGVNALTASAADETTSTALTDFVMLSDPSIRASNAVDEEGNSIGNGIRFSAEVDKTQYEALDDNGATVTAGTFIMPYNYIQGVTGEDSLKKEHFFGENACFVWGDTVAAQGQYKILHVEASAYETESKIAEGETVYRINGSVVNMKKVNLEREYIGVCYLAVTTGETTEYYLANTDEMLNKRSTLQVAQNILLGTPTDIETTVATNYLQTYIDWYTEEIGVAPTREVVTEYYVDSSEGYSKSNTLSKTETITMDEVADFTTAYEATEAPTLDGYTYAVGATENVASTIISADNGGKLSYYFDKNNDYVIFDGATMTMKDIASSVDHTTVTDADVVLRNFAAPDASTGNPGLVSSGEWGYYGENSIKMRSPGAGGDWANVYFHNAITFPATSKFSFVIRSGYSIDSDREISAEFYNQNGKYYSTKIPRAAEEGKVSRVTVDLGTEVTSITRIAIYTGGTPEFWIDCICAEYELYATGGNIEVAKDQTSVEIDVGNNLGTTVFSDEELSTATISVSYTALNGGSAVTPTLDDGKFTLQVAAETDYRIDYTATIGDKSVSNSFYVFGYFENMIADFDSHGANWTEKVMNSANTYGYAYDKDGIVKAGTGIDGGNAYYIQQYTTNWAGIYTDKDITLSTGANTLCMYIYCPSAEGRTYAPSGSFIEFYNGTTWPSCTLSSTALQYGWNYVEVTVNNTTDSDYVCHNFIIKTNAALVGCYFDRIALK